MKKPLYGDWNTTPRSECIQTGERIDRETLFHFKENSRLNADSLIQIDEVADIAGGTPLYDTIYREHEYAPWIYGGQCEAGSHVNRNPALMPMVYICSQYRADTEEELLQHIEVAKWACRDIAKAGAIPIAPHLYFPRFLDDSRPMERYYGLGAGLRMAEFCNTFYVVTVNGIVSEGMQAEIKYMTEVLRLEGSFCDLTKREVQDIMRDRMER
ncbi:MAG TPA: hypothetical protein H9713_11460 [Candidatus Mediterraneibacter surreyensis]|nr:hypothetical protein [Candidatus Mediterraneibacter surreyensis]